MYSCETIGKVSPSCNMVSQSLQCTSPEYPSWIQVGSL